MIDLAGMSKFSLTVAQNIDLARDHAKGIPAFLEHKGATDRAPGQD